MNRREKLIRQQQRTDLIHNKKGQYAMIGGELGGAGLGYLAGRAISNDPFVPLFTTVAGMSAGIGATFPYAFSQGRKANSIGEETRKKLRLKGEITKNLFSPVASLQLRRLAKYRQPYLSWLGSNFSPDVSYGTSMAAVRGLGQDIKSGLGFGTAKLVRRKSRKSRKKGIRRHGAARR
jgi:F0F1-type ATP synthase assembly protein I